MLTLQAGECVVMLMLQASLVMFSFNQVGLR